MLIAIISELRYSHGIVEYTAVPRDKNIDGYKEDATMGSKLKATKILLRKQKKRAEAKANNALRIFERDRIAAIRRAKSAKS